MNKLYILCLLFLAAPAMGAAPGAVSDTEKVRKAIDDICGDTWCEGDYSFRFKRVVLDADKTETRVFFSMGLRGFEPRISNNENFDSKLEQANFDVSCTIKSYFNVRQIMSDDKTLKWEFYEQMSDCVHSIEQRLRKLSDVLYDSSVDF